MGTTPTTPTYPLPIGGIMLAGITLVDQSAAFDPSSAVKRWVDPSKATLPPNDPANYMVFDPGSGTEVPLRITNAVASTANVPAVYPPVPAPAATPATLTYTSSTQTSTIPVSQYNLSTLDQANTLAATLSQALGMQFAVTVWTQTGWTFNPNGDARQLFMVSATGVIAAYAGELLVAQDVNGAGAPGSWALNASSQIVWNAIPVPQVGPNTPPDIPFPVRALLPGESFQSAGLPGIWGVTSSTSPAALAAPATAGQVGQLQSDLNLIKQVLGING